MSTTYTGDPAATRTPASTPLAFAAPALTLPADGDALNAASIAQPFEVLADYAARQSAMPLMISENWNYIIGSTTSSKSPITTAQGWTLTVGTTGGSLIAVVPDSTYPRASVHLSNTTGSNNIMAVSTASTIFYPDANAILTLDVDIGLNVTSGTNKSTFYVGIADSYFLPAASVDAMIFTGTPGGTWTAEVINSGSIDSTDTLITIPSSTTPAGNRLRIEFFGSSTSLGLKARFYVDGVLKATKTPGFLNNDAFYIVFSSNNDTGAGTGHMRIGSINYAISRW